MLPPLPGGCALVGHHVDFAFADLKRLCLLDQLEFETLLVKFDESWQVLIFTAHDAL